MKKTIINRAGVKKFFVEGKKEENVFQIPRKCNAVEDLFYSSKNKVAVEEEMLQINDLTELLLSLHN